MLFSIGDFSDISGLPPQTLRFYHSEGLLVPESVDEQTKYRSYAGHQVDDALLITTLRQAGLSVRDVRRALDDRDRAGSMLRDHVVALAHQRRREDEAIAAARSLLASWPEARRSRYPGQTVLSALVSHRATELRSTEHSDERWYDWDRADQSFHDTVRELRELAVAHRLDEAGTAWKTPAVETSQQKLDSQTAAGPHSIAKLPVVVPDPASLADAMPPHVEVQTWFARDELSIRLPGRLAAANYFMGLHRLMHHGLDDLYTDLGPGGNGSSCTTTRSTSRSPCAWRPRTTTNHLPASWSIAHGEPRPPPGRKDPAASCRGAAAATAASRRTGPSDDRAGWPDLGSARPGGAPSTDPCRAPSG